MTVALVKARTRQEHITLIAAAWQRGVESVIETGERIAAAKLELPHGEFEAMVEADLPFSPSTARRLMQIASHGVISNRAHGPVLPPSWRTLYELTKLPQTLLLEKIKDGSITPELERKDVRALLPPPEPEQRDDDLPPDYEGSNAPSPEDKERLTRSNATNPLVAMWAKANTEQRREFVMVCWDEMLPHSPVVGIRTPRPGPAKPNGNAGAYHWAHLSRENTEDRWIESDT